ncbi:hypothetical protein Agub_g15063, partial [Astrephomene gubernaculifera]
MSSSMTVGYEIYSGVSAADNGETMQESGPVPTSLALPPEILRYHLAPRLYRSSLRAFRLASRASRVDVAAFAITSIRRPAGTHNLPPDLGFRFPRLVRLDLSGDTQLDGGLSLFQALQSVSGLTWLNLSGCCGLRASFVARQLPAACPKLQHLALSCSCSSGADPEAALLTALASAPLAASLTSLELHCTPAFQPELTHITSATSAFAVPAAAAAGGGGDEGGGGGGSSCCNWVPVWRLRSLHLYGSRTLDDAALAGLPRAVPDLAELVLIEQHSRRGRHIRGGGLTALTALTGLTGLTLGCTEPDTRRLAAAVATLTGLRDLDLSRCDPQILDALAPLSSLLCCRSIGGFGGESLLRLSLPTAYTEQQLSRGLPTALGGGEASGLRSLRLHASSALPDDLVRVMSGLSGLREMNLAHCGPPPGGGLLAAVAAALTGLTSCQLTQEYGSGEEGGGDGGGGGGVDEGLREADRADVSSDRGVVRGCGGGDGGGVGGTRIVAWVDAVPLWRNLRQLLLTDVDALYDKHLYDMGRTLTELSYFSLSRNTRVTGEGFSSWPNGCCQLTTVTLYDCCRIADAAVIHLATLPRLQHFSLEHLPGIGADGVRHLAAHCTALRSLTLERLSAVPGEVLANLFWRLPLLECLSLRMCDVTNQTLEAALGAHPRNPPQQQHQHQQQQHQQQQQPQSQQQRQQGEQEHQQGEQQTPATRPQTPAAPPLCWLELTGCQLLSTAGLRALRGAAPGLTYLNLSYCVSVGEGVVELLLLGG